MDAATEAELLRRCRLGEAEAWDIVFDHHYKSAGRFVFQLSLNLTPEDVEEVCQEAFLSVIRNPQRLSWPIPFSNLAIPGRREQSSRFRTAQVRSPPRWRQAAPAHRLTR